MNLYLEGGRLTFENVHCGRDDKKPVLVVPLVVDFGFDVTQIFEIG